MYTLMRYAFKTWTYRPEYLVCIIGFQRTGKTSIFNEICRLYDPTRVQRPLFPTFTPNEAYVRFDSMNLRVVDLPGELGHREKWSNYLIHADAIVFVVDVSATSDHWEECVFVLKQITQVQELMYRPICVCFNKCDLIQDFTIEELEQRLNFKNPSSETPLQIFTTFVSPGHGSFRHLGVDQLIIWMRQTLPRAKSNFEAMA